MVRRANSSPPGSNARRAAEAAAAAVGFAAAAAEEAEQATTSQAGASTEILLEALWPLETNASGKVWFVAREHPDLEDGIWTVLALRNRGIDVNRHFAKGLLDRFVTAEPVLRRSKETGSATTTIFWH